jgi:peptide/nickel transport system permease protein
MSAMAHASGIPRVGTTQWSFSQMIVVALALPPAGLIAAQARAIMRSNLASAHGLSLLAAGASPLQLRRRLLNNVIAELSSTFEKVINSTIATLVFVEAIFSTNGFGAMLARAIQRSDINLATTAVALIATAIVISRFGTDVARGFYGLERL